MNKRGLYYHLVESQEQNFTSDEVDSHHDSNLEPLEQDKSTTDELSQNPLKTHPQTEEKINKSIQPPLPLQRASKDKDVSMWEILKLNKPEWEYITLGVIGSAILGLSTPVYAMVYGELMGLLDPALPADEAQQLNNTLALVKSFYSIYFENSIKPNFEHLFLDFLGYRFRYRLGCLYADVHANYRWRETDIPVEDTYFPIYPLARDRLV